MIADERAYFFVPGDPQPQGNKTLVPTARGPRLVEGRSSKSRGRFNGWRAAVAYSARAARVELHDGPVVVLLTFWLPRPKTVKREMPTVAPDLDKLQRAVFDALTGIAYRDDSQVIAVTARKEYATAEQPPGVDVYIGAPFAAPGRAA